VDRLAALATTRQVIVFTHDLPFYCELKTKAEREKVPVEIRSIQAAGRLVGAVRVGAPFIAMSVADREAVLQELINKANNAQSSGTPEEVATIAFQFYGGLRSTWERAVEELLFNKVVSRFEEEVKTKSLTGAIVDEEAIKTVFAAMSKCSGLIDGHDHAVAVNENAAVHEGRSGQFGRLGAEMILTATVSLHACASRLEDSLRA
jgi:hypothetical protein